MIPRTCTRESAFADSSKSQRAPRDPDSLPSRTPNQRLWGHNFYCLQGGGATDGLWTEVCGQHKQSSDPGNNQHILNTPIIGRR